MSEPRGTPETSMEEILASIRRIISEDNIQPPPGMRPAPIPRQSPIEPSPILMNPAPPPVPSASTQPAMAPAAPVIVAPVIVPPPSAAPTPAPSPAPSPSGAPSAVWGVLGDQHGAGEELVLTQMVAGDGSVVALEAPGRPVPAAQPASAGKAEPLDVLLLTDALPGSLPDIAMPVTPPVEPPPPPAPAPIAAPALVLRPEPLRTAPAPAAPVAAPRPPAPSEPDRVRIGLAPEPLVTPAAVLEQLARVRNQTPGQPSGLASNSPAAPTLEDLVRQSLEPKIQEWLNTHLKEIVERLVQMEIDKISSRT